MKRILLCLMILIIAVSGAFADEGRNKGDLSHSTATVSLDLNSEHFRIGFANSEANAKSFTATDEEFVLNPDIKDGAQLTAKNTDGSMYFFYKAALEKSTTYSLSAKIDKPLTQQDESGDVSGGDTIKYKATITGEIENTDFKDGTWVKQTVAASEIKSEDASATKILANLRGSASGPYTVVYASALKIALATTEENIGAKKAAVYKSTITFTVTADK